MFYPYEGYRSVTPLDAAGVNRTISHNHSVHGYYITLIKGRYNIKHDIDVRHGTYCRNMTVSATSCVVSTKYSIVCILFRAVFV